MTTSTSNAVTVKFHVVYISITLVFVSELLLSYLLYDYINDVDKRCIANVQISTSPTRSTRRKRAAVLDDNAVTTADVEFYNPKLRSDIEDKDGKHYKKNGASGGVNGDAVKDGESENDPWVWLTSYSRMPLSEIKAFCSATREYCPPGLPGESGPPGLPGIRGIDGTKGERGDRGFPGEMGTKGLPGQQGPTGPRGPKGTTGWPGSPGLDGRDGLPGEPGLDGIPGRLGIDGRPGIDGVPGINGTPGTPGTNGNDGKPGERGPIGPPGPKGESGMPGPRGRVGKPGIDGRPGIPGINAWNVSVNGSYTNELLIPPSIAASFTPSKAITLKEGDNIRMRCGATGNPKPIVEWRKYDGSPIPTGNWQSLSVSGYMLNITRISRAHMGIYMCVADNGIPPKANQSFILDVHFSPLIRIHTQTVGAANKTNATIECDVESYPEAVRYWERFDNRFIERNKKFELTERELGTYRVSMQLKIIDMGPSDYGEYYCIAKNEHGYTRGRFKIYEIDPRLATPPTIHKDGQNVVVFGQVPPEPQEEKCPPILACPECPEPKCKEGSVSLIDLVGRLDIQPFGNDTYPGLPSRTLDCVLYAVGKPVYHRYTDETFGSWMRDPQPKTELAGEMYWVTKETDPNTLYEFANKTVYKKDFKPKMYKLDKPFRGNAHCVYNGSFYYNQFNKSTIVKYDLLTRTSSYLDVPQAAFSEANYLYTTEYNFMDFSVDDNGLWVIFGLASNNNTVVMKLDSVTLQKQYMWNISINHHKVGEMFVTCGVLYAVDSVTERNTKIRLALDLYKNLLLDVNLAFTNPFRKTTMLGYNHRSKELYTWDKGNQLTYPIRYHEIGYNSTKDDKEPEASAQVQTGYEIDEAT